MKKYYYALFTLIISSGLLFTSCKKKEVDNETQSVTDHALCEQEFMRILPEINGKALFENGIKKTGFGSTSTLSGTCPKDSVIGDTSGYVSGAYTTTTNLPGILLDWGSGCTDQNDGVARSGKIRATFSKPYSQVGCVITATPVNYKVGTITYSGTIKITRTASNAFSVEVTDGHSSNGSWNISWNCSRTVTWISGMGDTDETNDVFEITGSSNGTNREGRAFSVNITSPLVKAASCKWIQKGTLEMTPDGLKTRVVDFGGGTCDNSSTFTVNGNTYTFTMQ